MIQWQQRLQWKKLQVFCGHHCIIHSSIIILYIMRSPISQYPTWATSRLWAVRNQRPLGIHDTSTEPSLSETRKWRGTMWDQWHPKSDSMPREGKSVNISLSHVSIVFNVIYIYDYVYYIYFRCFMYWEPNLPGLWSLFRSFYIVGLWMMLYTFPIVAYINNFDSD